MLEQITILIGAVVNAVTAVYMAQNRFLNHCHHDQWSSEQCRSKAIPFLIYFTALSCASVIYVNLTSCSNIAASWKIAMARNIVRSAGLMGAILAAGFIPEVCAFARVPLAVNLEKIASWNVTILREVLASKTSPWTIFFLMVGAVILLEFVRWRRHLIGRLRCLW